MEKNQFVQLHQAVDILHSVRQGEPWPRELSALLEDLSYAISRETGFHGDCKCAGSNCAIEIECTPLDSAINEYPSFITWEQAERMYDLFPHKSSAPDEVIDEDLYQQPGESDLAFAKRCINNFREGDSYFSNNDEDTTATLQLTKIKLGLKEAWFWITSQPGRSGNYESVYPKAWPDLASALTGTREIGFRDVQELIDTDLFRLGFPPRNESRSD